MPLSNNILLEFAKATKNTSSNKSETTVYGTVVQDNGVMYVKLDGSNRLTPMATTAEVKSGERVMVLIKNHTATITGNISSPSTSVDSVSEIGEEFTKPIENRLNAVEALVSDKASITQLENVEAAVETLETDNTRNKERLTSLETETDTLLEDTNNVKEAVNELESSKLDISTAESVYVQIDDLYLKPGNIIDLSIGIYTVGIINSAQELYFMIPVSKPILGVSEVLPSCSNGFKLIQNGVYTHGSSEDIYITPIEFTGVLIDSLGVRLKATFENVNGVTSDSEIGIIWSGLLTLN